MGDKSNNEVMGVRQAGELDHAMARNGWTPDDVKWLSSGDTLRDVLKLRSGTHVIAPIGSVRHIIDCDADPFVPEGWSIEEHVKSGQLEWDLAKIELYLHESQENFGPLGGHDLRLFLSSKSMMNANVLDYLLANQGLIPEEWKGKAIFFWGTIYRDLDGRLCVRCLYWNGKRWDWGFNYLASAFDDRDPAALCK